MNREINPNKTGICSWIIYDMSSTLFFSGVVGLVFPLWVTGPMGGNDATVGYTLTVSMILVFFLSPFLGVFSDSIKKRMPFILILTLLGFFMIMSVGTFTYKVSIIIFCIAASCLHLVGIFYNGMLSDITTRKNVGYIGGIGVGIGYVGGILAVILGVLFLESMGHVFLFRLMAITSLILATPLLIVGNYRTMQGPSVSIYRLLLVSVKFTSLAVTKSFKDRNWMFFLFARFWYLWAVNAASFFAVLYGVNTVELSEREVQLILLLGIVTGIPMGLVWGWVTDRMGPLFVMKINVFVWVIILSLAASIPIFDLQKELWWLVGPFSGSALAGLYVSERPFVLSLAGRNQIGEFFGVFNMAGRLAAIVGPFSWGFISVTLGLGQTAAIICLAICVTIALIILMSVKAPKTQSYL